jgi:uncharacterized delta-60 repeat protein
MSGLVEALESRTLFATTDVLVPSTAGPWTLQSGLNAGSKYGDGNQSEPVVVNNISPGDSVNIQYVTGDVGTNFQQPANVVDANGYVGTPGGASGFPAAYTNTPGSSTFFQLMGTFADANGTIIAAPFLIGDGPVTFIAPAGASQLDLGLDDNTFLNNWVNGQVGGQPLGTGMDIQVTNTAGVSPPAAPDLALQLSYTQGNYTAGATLPINWTEQNFGNLAAGAYDVQFALSTDQVFGNGDDISLAVAHESGLAAGATRPVSLTPTIPANVPTGNYFLVGKIDSANSVAESAETNNVATADINNIVVAGATTTPTPIQTIGGLDKTFGINGLASHNVGFSSTAGVVLQSDGKSIIAGTAGTSPNQRFGLTRYNTDGSLDTSFGNNGVVDTSFGGNDQATAVAYIPATGEILVAGTDTTSGGSRFAVTEFTSTGAINAGFGGGAGFVLSSFSTTPGTLSHDTAKAIVVAPNGTIYVAGSSDAAGKGLDFAVASYNADGSANSRFGGSGMATLDFAGGDDAINAIALQTNGNLVAAGSSVNPASGIASIALARFLPTAALDSRFGSKGKVTTSVRGVADAASSVAIDRTGKIVIGGVSATGSASAGTLSSDFVVARYTALGAIDKTFGGGPVITSFGQPSAVSQVVIETDGKIIASGKTVSSLTGLDPSQLQVAVARYTAAGKLDPSFNAAGAMPGTIVLSLAGAGASPSAQVAHPSGSISPAMISSFQLTSFAITPQDTASSLLNEFAQFQQTSQGVVAITPGGELLDVGNSGANTVEAAIIVSGIDLAAKIVGKLPAAAVEGAKGLIGVQVTENGTDPAAGAVTIQILASLNGQANTGTPLTLSPTAPPRINLRQNQSHVFVFHYTLPSSVGNYFLVTNVTPPTSQRELNANNNVAASSTPVQVAAPFIDLAGSGLISVGTVAVGKFATISFTVANNGNVLAKSVPVQVLASPNGTVAGGTQVAEPTLLLNLPATTTRKYRLTFKMPSTLPATNYTLVVVLDPANTLSDPNLANNVIVGSQQFVVT